MVRRMLVVVAVIAAAAGAFMALVVTAMWTKSPRLLRTVRVFNRTVTNRLQRPFAGTPGAYASVVRHEGRISGRRYETPVVPFEVPGGFIVSLPYGPSADWVQNVLAKGSAELVHDGRTFAVDRPEVMSVSGAGDLFPPSEQRTHRMFRVEHCLRLHLP